MSEIDNYLSQLDSDDDQIIKPSKGFTPDSNAPKEPNLDSQIEGLLKDSPAHDRGFTGALIDGAKSTGRAISSTYNTYTGDGQAVVDNAQAQELANEDKNQDIKNFQSDWAANTGAGTDEEVGLWGAIKGTGKAIVDNPRGAALSVVEQFPNSVPTLAAGWAGAKGGAMAGGAVGSAFAGVGAAPGAVIGGITGFVGGMFLGNTLTETGYKAQEYAADGEFTPDEQSAAITEGAKKAGVITAVDALTFAIGGKVSSTMRRTAESAVEAATRKTLLDAGVDISDTAALTAARSNPQIASQVVETQKNAAKIADNLRKRAGEVGALLTMETVGEGLGEYLGELAATGQASVSEAVLESFLSLGQSGVQTMFNLAKARDSSLTDQEWVDAANGIAPEGIAPEQLPVADGIWDELTPEAKIDMGQMQDGGVTPTPVFNPQDIDRNLAPTPSQQMGINPNAGPLSAAAAQSVDSGLFAGGFTPQAGINQSALEREGVTPPPVLDADQIDRNLGSIDPITGEYIPAPELLDQPNRAGSAGNYEYDQWGNLSKVDGRAVEGYGQDQPRLGFNNRPERSAAPSYEVGPDGVARPTTGEKARSMKERVDLSSLGANQKQAAPKQQAQQPAAQRTPEQDAQSIWDNLNTFERNAAATKVLGMRGVPAKNTATKAWGKLSPKQQAKLTAGLDAQQGQRWTDPNQKVADQTGPVLQNRDRTSQDSINQMRGISNNPDYSRLKTSGFLSDGAPVAIDENIKVPASQLGVTDTASAGGKKFNVQYAVVEADQFVTSNSIDGRPNTEYAAGSAGKSRAISGNGRITGLQSAWAKGKADQYKADMAADKMHGIDAAVIEGMKNPILVRLLPQDEVTDNIGDLSNRDEKGKLSPVEQSKTDMGRIDLDSLKFTAEGAIGGEAIHQFRMAQPAAERVSEAEARKRLTSAIFQKAYGNDQLTEIQSGESDDAKSIMSALAQAAPSMSRLEGAGEFDIRPLITQAGIAAVNAARRGTKLADYVQQSEMGIDPMVYPILEMMLNEHGNIRSSKYIGEQLTNMAKLAYDEANSPRSDMFGEKPKRTAEQVIQDALTGVQGYGQINDGRGQESLGQRGRSEPDAQMVEGPEGGRERPADTRQAAPAQQEPARKQPETEVTEKPISLEPTDTSVRVYGDVDTIRQRLRAEGINFSGAEIDGGLSFGKKLESKIKAVFSEDLDQEAMTDMADDTPIEMVQAEAVEQAVEPQPEAWRTNYMRAAKVARDLGIDPKQNKKLAELVAAIDAFNAEPVASQPNQQVAAAKPAADSKTGVLIDNATDMTSALAAIARGAQLRTEPNGDVILSGTKIITLPKQPTSVDEVIGALAVALRDQMRADGVSMPSNPADMTRDQFVVAYEFANIIPEFEITGEDIGGVVQGSSRGLTVDADKLYDKIIEQSKAQDNPALELNQQTEESLAKDAKRLEQLQKEKAAQKAKQKAAESKARERDADKARADEVVDDFQLGQSAEEVMSGMGDIFDASPSADKPDAADPRVAQLNRLIDGIEELSTRASNAGDTDLANRLLDRYSSVTASESDPVFRDLDRYTVDTILRSLEPDVSTAEKKAQVKNKDQSTNDSKEARPDADRFAGNKLFTADKVQAARDRIKSKFGQLNSGIDPEMLVDGMTIAGAYIESGVRKFSDYAKAMIEDLGDGVKPYLLSFWEGARNYPGLDTEGMTSPTVSRIQFEAMTNKEQAAEIAPEAVGVVADKPVKRVRKTGAKGDMVLTQDWGVPHIDGYGDSNDRETGNDTKDAFLKEARGYLNAVSDALRSHGFEPHLDRRGKAEKPVSVNEGGNAGSGDVTLIMQNPDNGNKAYITIGDTSLRGVVPSTESGIAIMYRVGTGEDRYASKHGNTWAPVDLSANELAQLVNNSAATNQAEVTNEQLANEDSDQGRTTEVRGTGRDPQQGASPEDRGDVGARQPTDGRAPEEAGAVGRSGFREPRADVAGDGSESKGGNVGDGRTGTGRAGSLDAGTRSAAERNKQPDLESPAAASVQAKDLHIDNPLEIVGGTPVQRFNRNRAALELLQSLEVEGRQANPEEQKTLAAYIGWGSFGQELFQGSWDKPVYRDEGVWKSRGEWLRDTLGESAWKSAQRSITNAHYTDPPTVMAMWDMVKRMGFTGGKVQEPSMGTGNFFSMMPADLKSRSQLTGIELDETTGAIAKQLFPRSNIRIMGYQESKTPDGFYDLIIGNWPFENTPVADRRYNKLDPMLHDYFFLKTLDQVRAGGIVIGITSAGSMDKQSTMIRRELARKSELIASIRLPSGAFADYAGTKVVTDIVILRKRPERLVAIPKDVNWIETGEVKTPSGEMVRVNQYYIDNPQNIIGTLDFGRGTTFREGMIVHRPENMAERLQQAIELVPADAFQQSTQVDHLTYYANESNERHGALALVGDKLMVAMGDQLVLANDKAKYEVKDKKQTADREAQLKGVAALGKLHTALVNAERKGDDAEPARKALNKAFKDFTSAHGPIRESFGLKYLQRIDDPYYAEIAALEGDDGKPAAVLERSTTRSRKEIKNPSVRDAYVLARNQSINPSIEEVAALAGKSPESVKQELMESGAVFEAPNGDIVPSDIYLSGNVRQKMREAQAGLAEGNKAMEKNVKALEEVMPADVPYFNIETKLGATWVSPQAYAQYVANMLSSESADGIEVAFRSGRWSVKLDRGLNQKPEASANYGTVHASFSRLVQAAMSNQTLRLTSKDADGNESYDPAKTEEVNARIAKIRDDFGTWLWSDPERRVDMELEYNEARNAWSTPKYDGSFLTFEGMALTLGKGQFNLREHQVNAIWRGIVNRRSLNAHEVGTGKTFTMAGIAVESRRYGIAKKPVLLAHNANSATVAAEIRQMYPQARVLYVDNLDAKNRAIRLRQIANDDWDVIVMPHSLIDRLSLREETLMEMAADDIAALESEFLAAAEEDGIDGSKVDLDDDEAVAKVRSVTAKELAKARKRIIENIKKQSQQASKEGAVSFEELGIDMVLVDEVHEFKKPPIVTRMQMKGLNTQVSGRSIALQFLTRYVRQMNNGGNVHTFTGTPITNTITEIYHQMRYVMENEMDDSNVADWDGWFGSFATEVQDVELSAAGDYEMVTRLAGFVNVPELRQMVGQYMDTVFADDMPEMQPRKTKSGKQLTDETINEAERAELLNGRTEDAKDRPYKKVINASADMTVRQQEVFSQLQGYAQDWRNASGKERRELMRKGDPRSPIVTEGIATKASFDVRLLDESLAGMEGKTNDDPNSKASRVVNNVLEIYKSNPLAGQVVFAEIGFSKSVRRTRTGPDGEKTTTTVKVFSTIHDVIERLVQGGIPRDQIALVDGSVKKERRREIAEQMNSGKLRVVLGSTDTLGVGVNMQKNLRAMHHMDAPYMPGELEQRNGRGQRQGNQWNTVLEYRYMTDRLDGRRWQILAVKQRFITAFMKANNNARVIEGEAAADEQSDILESFSEAAGDPRILQRVKLQKKEESLKRKERMYTQGISGMRRQARNSAERATQLTGRLEKLKQAGTEENIQKLITSQREAFKATIDGKSYGTRVDAVKALESFAASSMRLGDGIKQVGTYAGHPVTMEWPGFHDEPATTIKAFGEVFSGKGIAGAEARMRNYFKTVEADVKERDAALATSENMQKAMQQPFAQSDELERVSNQLKDLEKDLEVNPVPPPAWLRQGAPMDSEVYWNKKPYVVTGHRYTATGWFVVADDDKGSILIPYMEAKDPAGMELYEERDFVSPEVQEQKKEEVNDAPKFSFAGQTARGADVVALDNANNAPITDASLVRAFDVQFPRLTKAVRTMLARGNKGKRGGVVVIDSADPLMIAREFAKKTGKPISQSVQMFSDAGVINGFFDPKSGLTFLVGPNLNPVTGTAVLLHEMMHGQQRQKIDKAALSMLMNRGKEKNAETRAFLDRVAARMDDAGETANAQEAGAYIVEQAVMEGKSAGYGTADSRFLSWVDQNIGKTVGDFLRSFIGNVRSWALRNGLPIGPITVDDLVSYAMAGMEQAGRGNVDGGVQYSKNATEDRLEGRRQFEETEKAYGGRAAYDQAKSEGKTKLNYQQWVQVRTPAFKDWFGDWENAGRERIDKARHVRRAQAGYKQEAAADTREAGGREDRNRVGTVLYGAGPLMDLETGEPRVFYHGTSEDIKAFNLNHPTRKDSGWLGRGVYVASDVRMANTYANTKNGSAAPNVMPVFIRSTSGLYQATLSDKQVGSGLSQENIDKATEALKQRGYDGAYLEFQSDSTIELVTYSVNNVKSASGNVGTFSAATDDISFSRSQTKTAAFKKQFGDSKVVDASGDPLLVYHGSGAKFATFDKNKRGATTRAKSAEEGFFFTSSKSLAYDFKKQAEGEAADLDAIRGAVEGLSDSQLESLASDIGRIASEDLDLEGRDFFIDSLMDMYQHDTDINTWPEESNGTPKALKNYIPKDILEPGAIHDVYLRIENPHEHVFDEDDDWHDEGAITRAISTAQKNGNDGVILRNMVDVARADEKGNNAIRSDVYIAFEPDQIIQSEDSAGIRFSRAANPASVNAAPNGMAAWDSPSASKFDDFVYKIQDKHVDTKRVIAAIRDTGKAISDDLDVYLQETLFHGRAAKRTQDFLNMEVNPLIEYMQSAKVDMSDLEEFLHARHAQEANALIAKRDPNMPDGGSGMTNAEAAKYLKSLNGVRRKQFENAAKMVDKIIGGTRETIVNYGLESQETVDCWTAGFKHYIPLQREDKDGQMGIGQGFSVKGKETKSRTGSTRKVVDILANVMMQRERIIVRGEKNRVAVAALGLAKDNPLPDFWQVDKVPTTRVLDKTTGLVRNQADPMYKSRDNAIVAKVNGQEHAILMNEDDPRAMRMAEALKNLDAAQLEGLLGATATATRYFAAVNTQYNPIFGVTNLVRDIQEAMLHLQSTPLAGQQARLFKNTFTAVGAVMKAERDGRKGNNATGKWGVLWEDFQNTGGQTGFRDQFSSSADRGEAIKSALTPDGWADTGLGKLFTAGGVLKAPLEAVRKKAAWMFDLLSDYNTAMENGVRLSAYETGINAGMSKEQAAALAKGLTVNFNRKGQVTQQVGALYAFFNASVQGSARLGQSLFDMEPGKPKTMRLSKLGKRIVSGGVLLGASQAVLLAMMGFDDDEPPEFIRERNIIIPTGDKTYISIPMPLGYHVIANLGRIPTEFALSGGKDGAKYLFNLMDVMADIYNPIGNSGLSMQTIAPTVLDPLAGLAENKDFSGRAIAKESFNRQTPGHALARDTASLPATWLTELINYATGGTEFTRGELSPTPDQIDYLVGQLTGGVGRETTKLMQSIQAAATGDDLPWHKIPLVGRFIGDADSDGAKQSAFYNNMDKVRKHAEEVKGLRASGRSGEAIEYANKHPHAKLHLAARAAEKQVKEMRDRKRDLEQAGAPREEIRKLEKQMIRRMEQFVELSAASK